MNKNVKRSAYAMSILTPLFILSTWVYHGNKKQTEYERVKESLIAFIAGEDKKITFTEAQHFLDEMGIQARVSEDESIVIRYELRDPLRLKAGFGIYLWDGTYTTNTYPPASLPNLKSVGRINLENATKYIKTNKR